MRREKGVWGKEWGKMCKEMGRRGKEKGSRWKGLGREVCSGVRREGGGVLTF